MFVKQIKVQQATRLKGKDKEAVITGLKKQFDPEIIKRIFQDSEQLEQQKLQGSKMIIYSTDEYPAFVEAAGAYIPSIYILSEYPQLLKTIIIKQGADAELIKSGQTKWTYVDNINRLGQFKKDDIYKVLSADKKILGIVAIGCDSQDLEKEKENGVAAFLLHKQGDKLWDHGPQELTEPVIPENYDEPIQEQNEKKQEEPGSDSEEDHELAYIIAKKQQNIDNKKKKPVKQVQPQKKQQNLSDSDDDKKHHHQKQQQKQHKQQEQQQQEQTIPTKIMDEYLREAFMNAIKIGISDKQLPLEGQEFYEKHLLQYKRENIDLNIKNTSYQKIGKFLQQMNKDGIIEYKELKKGQPTQIIKIDRGHELLEAWEPTVQKGGRKQKDKDDDENEKQDARYVQQVEIEELYLPQGQILQIFVMYAKEHADQKEQEEEENIKEPKIEPLSKEEYQKQLNWYIRKYNTVDKKSIILKDQILTQLVQSHVEVDDDEEEQHDHKDHHHQKDRHKDQRDDHNKEEEQAQKKKTDNVTSFEQAYKIIEKFMIHSHKITYIQRKDPVQIQKQDQKAKLEQLKQEQLELNPNHVPNADEVHQMRKQKQKLEKQKEKEIIDHKAKFEIKNGAFKGLQIIAEKQQNQQITRIIGLEQFGFENDLKHPENIYTLQYLQAVFSKQFETQVSIHELPVKQGGREIVINKTVLDDLVDHFVNVVKIDEKHIRQVNKIASKKKPQTVKQ